MTESHTNSTMSPVLYRSTIEAPFGFLSVVASDSGIVAIRWDTEIDDRYHDAHNPVDRALSGSEINDVAAHDHPILSDAATQLAEYFNGSRTVFDVPLAPVGTAFQRQAWDVLTTIPYGTTMTYGEQARALGDPNKARAVGAANGRNPIPIIVPCHRVVGSNGNLTGFAGGIEVKAWLLDHELRSAAAVAN